MSDETNRFYVIFRQLEDMAPPDEAAPILPEELDEIDQIRKMVLEVTEERPKFCTST